MKILMTWKWSEKCDRGMLPLLNYSFCNLLEYMFKHTKIENVGININSKKLSLLRR